MHIQVESRRSVQNWDLYPLVMTNSLLLKMAIEIVDLPIKNGDVLQLC